MAWIGVVLSLLLIGIVFLDAFEAIILPRRVRHAYRLAKIFYRSAWIVWSLVAPLIPSGRRRRTFLSFFGPLSLFALIFVWAAGLIAGFALLHWSLGTSLSFPKGTDTGFPAYLYFSGSTFFTLGYGDIVPTGTWGRLLCVGESGLGFGFLAVVITYLPVLYQAFSRCEIVISLLDARAGSPPSAGEMLRRLADARSLANIGPMLIEWERWSAELLESHLSFPVLRFYRSQHDNQSWLAALTTILDTTAILISNVERCPVSYQARLTFAMARHAAVDLMLIAQTAPRAPAHDRLPAADLARLRASLSAAGIELVEESSAARSLAELRGLYEPFVNILSTELQFPLPHFVVEKPPVDNWQTGPGMPRSPGLIDLQAAGARDEHAN